MSVPLGKYCRSSPLVCFRQSRAATDFVDHRNKSTNLCRSLAVRAALFRLPDPKSAICISIRQHGHLRGDSIAYSLGSVTS